MPDGWQQWVAGFIAFMFLFSALMWTISVERKMERWSWLFPLTCLLCAGGMLGWGLGWG